MADLLDLFLSWEGKRALSEHVWQEEQTLCLEGGCYQEAFLIFTSLTIYLEFLYSLVSPLDIMIN